eukprot:4216863-Prymnesium_polylepis.1
MGVCDCVHEGSAERVWPAGHHVRRVELYEGGLCAVPFGAAGHLAIQPPMLLISYATAQRRRSLTACSSRPPRVP